MWNGAAPSLNASPATTNTVPNASTCRLATPLPMTSNTVGKSRDPVAPYIIDKPYSRNPLASAPSTKYFIAASVDCAWSRRSATSAYSDRLISSRPR